mmetsp:Transcript_20854/g.67175  ORF Transcript_20854/g.67175 Transcript_20854/m.67175 type:complete len:328 (+) Transcript_20854:71-1054(+)|eukprot:CAMPEP_0118895972 /NCGR_PEP_ID=MMETSP1166-20130328/4071_1 /TAXON_ID=1104430 /ORGANISM="Chrysoreinhardia sp, Strain CCMP3193" /LENGTH=327 /DNA_ID=CAMNT_0006835023 /DNA_START=71 /DNA_END=1054 /DNA_ORIENTATION=+
MFFLRVLLLVISGTASAFRCHSSPGRSFGPEALENWRKIKGIQLEEFWPPRWLPRRHPMYGAKELGDKYDCARNIWFGSVLASALLFRDYAQAGGYLVASCAAARLARHARDDRLSTPATARLNAALVMFGLIQSAGSALPLDFFAICAIVGGATEGKGYLHRDLKRNVFKRWSLVPKTKAAASYFFATVVPCFVAVLASTAPTLGDALTRAFLGFREADVFLVLDPVSATLGPSFLLFATALILQDAANRPQTRPSATVQRLNLALAAGLAMTALKSTGFLTAAFAAAGNNVVANHHIFLSKAATAVAAIPPAFFGLRAALTRRRL